jgi:hypothetical protein
MTARGRWHGQACCFGFHHDLHAEAEDAGIGTRCSLGELVPMLERCGADFV